MSSKVAQSLRQAEQIRYNYKTSCVQLQNYLYYQRLQLSSNSKTSLMLCGGCSTDKAVVKDSFKRAFKSLSEEEQAQFYLKNCQYVADFIQGKNNPIINSEPTTHRTSLGYPQTQNSAIRKVVEIKQSGHFGKWNKCNVQILVPDKVIRILDLKQEIDLRYFLLRKSKNKSKSGFALEATEGYSDPQTLRVSTVKEVDFEQFYELILKLSDQAQRERVVKMMVEQKKFPKMGKDSKIRLMKSPMVQVQEPTTIRLLKQESNSKSLQKNIEQSVQAFKLDDEVVDKIGEKILSKEIFMGLNTFQQFTEVSPGVFHQKKGRKVRRVFTFKNEEIVNFQWLLDQLFQYRIFHQWKASLQMIELLNKFPAERSYIFHEIDYYKNKAEIDYTYVRHYALKDNTHYFIDKSVQDPKFGPKCTVQARGKINHCVWRFRRIGNDQTEVLVEADIQHGISGDNRAFSEQFIGQFDSIVSLRFSEENQQFMEDNDILINTMDFEKEYLSQIGENMFEQEEQQAQNEQLYNNQDHTEFYSLDGGSDYSFNKSFNNNRIDSRGSILSNSRSVSRETLMRKSRRTAINNVQFSLVKQNSDKGLLQAKHIVDPLPPSKFKKLLSSPHGHFFWGKEWQVPEKGGLINMNEQKIKVQSSVLKLVIKKMGSNLLRGKSIINTSMPIQIFDELSFLQRLCRCFTYGPIALEKAANAVDPIQKFKATVAFAVGADLNFMEMQKPFNPILGQTYQGVIDGCPCYAQQISHHPPIASLFMMGRGYTVYGTKQPKIQLGLNSASGSNVGLLSVSFASGNLTKQVIKFSSASGQISGLIYGPRFLKVTGKSVFFDETNRLFCEIKYGKAKVDDQDAEFDDFFYGNLVQLNSSFQTDSLPSRVPSKKDIARELGMFRGRWTQRVYFNSDVIFDVNAQAPCVLQQYQSCLESHSNKRRDIQLRKQLLWSDSQEAKQQLQELQRHDAKLRRNRPK